ncbi:MAG: hypothetical protein C0426_15695 [Rhodobacter sp.]|nr:hypothetical protein [Rhodobacter sp.]
MARSVAALAAGCSLMPGAPAWADPAAPVRLMPSAAIMVAIFFIVVSCSAFRMQPRYGTGQGCP